MSAYMNLGREHTGLGGADNEAIVLDGDTWNPNNSDGGSREGLLGTWWVVVVMNGVDNKHGRRIGHWSTTRRIKRTCRGGTTEKRRHSKHNRLLLNSAAITQEPIGRVRSEQTNWFILSSTKPHGTTLTRSPHSDS